MSKILQEAFAQTAHLPVADLEWLAAHRVERKALVDAGTLVSQMRDEDWP